MELTQRELALLAEVLTFSLANIDGLQDATDEVVEPELRELLVRFEKS